MKPGPRGAILIIVMVVLAMLGILGAALSRAALHRVLMANAMQKAERDASRCRGGGTSACHATMPGDAHGASSNE